MEIKKLQNYLIDRVIEVLHKETLDSYRLRNNNAFTSLVEVRDTILRWNQMKVKTFETVKMLGNECVTLLERDNVLQYKSYGKMVFVSEFSDFLRRNDKCPDQIANSRILYCLDKCISENRYLYLSRLMSCINDKMEKGQSVSHDKTLEYLSELDAVVSAFCVQLVYSGYSKQHLYLTLKKTADSYASFHSRLESLVDSKEKDYIVIWKVTIPGGENIFLDRLGFMSHIYTQNTTIESDKQIKNYLTPCRSEFFFSDNVSALDNNSAMKKSRENLMKKIDTVHLGKYNCSIRIPSKVLICKDRPKECQAAIIQSSYFLDGIFSNDLAVSLALTKSLNKIYSNSNIDISVKDRLQSAIRHLNCGDTDTELEQRFINYWIALEFVFSSPYTEENTYSRLKTHLINVLSCSYIRRNIDYLNKKMIDAGLIDAGYNLFASTDTLDTVAEREDLPLLWYVKLKKMKSRLYGNKDKRKEYYKNHITNLQCHLARIYNLRNALVHEGALNQDVENITSNLRYYLVFVLDQMISYFHKVNETEDCKKVVLDDFFNEYISYSKMIEENYDLSKILSIPVSGILW